MTNGLQVNNIKIVPSKTNSNSENFGRFKEIIAQKTSKIIDF